MDKNTVGRFPLILCWPGVITLAMTPIILARHIKQWVFGVAVTLHLHQWALPFKGIWHSCKAIWPTQGINLKRLSNESDSNAQGHVLPCLFVSCPRLVNGGKCFLLFQRAPCLLGDELWQPDFAYVKKKQAQIHGPGWSQTQSRQHNQKRHLPCELRAFSSLNFQFSHFSDFKSIMWDHWKQMVFARKRCIHFVCILNVLHGIWIYLFPTYSALAFCVKYVQNETFLLNKYRITFNLCFWILFHIILCAKKLDKSWME